MLLEDKSAQELSSLWERDGIADKGDEKNTEYGSVFQRSLFKMYIFRLRAKFESGGQVRIHNTANQSAIGFTWGEKENDRAEHVFWGVVFALFDWLRGMCVRVCV
jgi:hypothetical protein